MRRSTCSAPTSRIWLLDEGDLCESGCRHAAITEGPDLCRDRSHCLHLVASSGRYTAIDGGHRRVPVGCYKIGRIASGEESTFVTNDVTRNPRMRDRQWAADLGLVSFAGYRLLSPKGTPLGVLALFSKRKIEADEDRLLELLANSAAQVIRAGRAEESLRQEKAFADIVIDSIPGVFYVLDSQGQIVRWNHLLEKVTGRPAEMLRRTDALDTIFTDDRRLVAEKIREVFEKGYAEAESRYLGKDEVREYWFTGRRMDVGPTSYLVGCGTDITDRKRSEEAHRESEERFRTVVEMSKDAIIAINRGGLVTVFNPAAEDMFGASSRRCWDSPWTSWCPTNIAAGTARLARVTSPRASQGPSSERRSNCPPCARAARCSPRKSRSPRVNWAASDSCWP